MSSEVALQPIEHIRGVAVQPRIHQMCAFTPTFIENSIHRHLPEARDLRLAFADIGEGETVIRQTIVECVGPVRVSLVTGERN